MTDGRDPGPEAVDKILSDLEDCKWSPADVARQARRLRAHIAALRARVRRCVDVHGESGLHDPELAGLAGTTVNALELSANPGRRQFKAPKS